MEGTLEGIKGQETKDNDESNQNWDNCCHYILKSLFDFEEYREVSDQHKGQVLYVFEQKHLHEEYLERIHAKEATDGIVEETVKDPPENEEYHYF